MCIKDKKKKKRTFDQTSHELLTLEVFPLSGAWNDSMMI